MYYRQACQQRSMPAGIATLYHGPKVFFFAPQGRHIALIKKGEIWHGGAGHRFALQCEISPLSRQNGNIVPTVKIWNFAHKFALRKRLVCKILKETFNFCTRLHVAFKFFIR